MSFRGQLIKHGINTNGIDFALWQAGAQFAIGSNVVSGVMLNLAGTGQTTLIQLAADATNGIVITSAFSGALGISLGAATYTTAALQIGTDAAKLELAVGGDFAIDINTNSDIVTGTNIAFHLKSTMAGRLGEEQTMYVHAYSSVYGGNENTVGHFYSQWVGTLIGPVGMASAVTAKMLLPESCFGAFYAFYGKMNMPESPGIMDPLVGAGNAAGWFMLSIGGETAGKTNFSENGLFMDIHNLTAGATSLLSANSQTLRCAIDVSTMRYLLLSTAEDCLTLGDCTVGVNLTGSMTDGIIISGACGDNGIEITGACTDSAIQVSGICTAGILKAGTSDGSLIDLGSPAIATSWVGIGIFGTLTGASGRNAGGSYPEDHGINIVLKEDGQVQFMYGIQSRAYAVSSGVAQEMFGLYGRARVESGGTVGYGSAGQCIGVYGLCYLKSGGTLDVGGAGVLAGGRFSYKDQGATHSTSGVKCAIMAEVEEGTPDCVMYILAHAGAGTIPSAIDFNNAGTDMTNLFKFRAATGFVDTSGHGAAAAGRITVDVAGSTRYLYLYSN